MNATFGFPSSNEAADREAAEMEDGPLSALGLEHRKSPPNDLYHAESE